MSLQHTRSTCPYCGVGCGVIIESDGSQIIGVKGDPDHPANKGKLCTKGSTLHLTASPSINQYARVLNPQKRVNRSSHLVDCSWDEAIDSAADVFTRVIQTHGPDAVGFYISGQLLTEDYYVFNKLAKGLIGTNNVDTNSRLCMSSAVAGYKMTLGADAPPVCYDDVNHASTIFIVGSNTAWAHPVLFRRIEEAKQNNPGLKIIFCDPRKTDTAQLADLYLPIQPGTDVMLFHGMLHIMLWEGWVNTEYIQQHTRGFDELKTTVREYTPERVAQTCGISQDDLQKATQWFAKSPATLSLYCQGLNQSSNGTAKNASLINLHLATGHIGKPGAGPFSLTGQPNAMGGREVGGLANLLSAHRDLSNPDHRAEVAALWKIPSVPSSPGKSAVEMFEAVADGQIKAIWIACTNPVQSMPNANTVRKALQTAEFVVVQEAFATTETCQFADLLLPATTWGEKTGTVTNSERCISRVRSAVPPVGQSRHDWAIAVNFAHALEQRLTPDQPTLFPYPSDKSDIGAELIWNEHRESTRGRDLDITGLSYALLEQSPQQWPMPEGAIQGKTRLYEDGKYPTADGKARFANVQYVPVSEPRESRYPFSLTTGRLRDQWHGMSRTGLLGRLFGHVAEPCIEMHPQDMDRRHIKPGDLVYVSSKRGTIVVPVQASDSLNYSQAFMAMHWGAEYLSGVSSTGEKLAGVNALTTSSVCPTSKQPELKHAAVKIQKADIPWSLLAVAWVEEHQLYPTQTALRQLMASFAFSSCVPFTSRTSLEHATQERKGILFRAADFEPIDQSLLEKIKTLFNLVGENTLSYNDAKKGQTRLAKMTRVGGDVHLDGFLLAGDTSSEVWIKTLLEDQLPAQSYGLQILTPGVKAPVAIQSKGKLVCTCMNVMDTEISAQLMNCVGDADEQLKGLQVSLKCGTSCGSCVPELKRMIAQHTHAAHETTT